MKKTYLKRTIEFVLAVTISLQAAALPALAENTEIENAQDITDTTAETENAQDITDTTAETENAQDITDTAAETEGQSNGIHFANESEISFSEDEYFGSSEPGVEDYSYADFAWEERIDLSDAEGMLGLSDEDITADSYVFSEELNEKYAKMDALLNEQNKTDDFDETTNNDIVYLMSFADAQSYNIGDTVEGDTSYDVSAYYKFDVYEDGIYTFSSISDSSMYLALYDENEKQISSEYSSGSYLLSANKLTAGTYYLKAYSYNNVSFQLTSGTADFDNIELDEEITNTYSGENYKRYYKFISDKDTMYSVSASSAAACSIYDEDFKSVSWDSWRSDENTVRTFYAKAGQEYYISLRNYYSSESEYTIMVSEKPVIEMEKDIESRFVYNSSDRYQYCVFTPQEAGGYDIESTGNAYVSAEIINTVTGENQYAYGSSGSYNNFAAAVYDNAGEKIIIKITSNSSYDGQEIGIIIKDAYALTGSVIVPQGSNNITQNQSVSCNIYCVASGTYNTAIMFTSLKIPKNETSSDFHLAIPINPSVYNGGSVGVESSTLDISVNGDLYQQGNTVAVSNYAIRFNVEGNIFYYDEDNDYTYDRYQASELSTVENSNVNQTLPEMDYVTFSSNMDTGKHVTINAKNRTVRNDIYSYYAYVYNGTDSVLLPKDEQFEYSVSCNGIEYKYNRLAGETIDLDAYNFNTVHSPYGADYKCYAFYNAETGSTYDNYYQSSSGGYCAKIPPDTDFIVGYSGVYYTGDSSHPWNADRGLAKIFNSSKDTYLDITAPETVEVNLTPDSDDFRGGAYIYSAKTGDLFGSRYLSGKTTGIVNVPVDEPYKVAYVPYFKDRIWNKNNSAVFNYDDASTYTGAKNITLHTPNIGNVNVLLDNGLQVNIENLIVGQKYRFYTYGGWSRIYNKAYYSNNGMVDEKKNASYVVPGSSINMSYMEHDDKYAYLSSVEKFDCAVSANIGMYDIHDYRCYAIDFIQYDTDGNIIKSDTNDFKATNLTYSKKWYLNPNTKYYSVILKNGSDEIIGLYTTYSANDSLSVSSEPVNEKNEPITVSNIAESDLISFDLKRKNISVMGCNVYVAVYSKDGRLVDVCRDNVIFDDSSSCKVTIDTNNYSEEIGSMKIMAWNDLNSPLMNIYEIK